MKNAEYWRKRSEAVEAQLHKKSEEYYREAEKQFKKAEKQIADNIEKWYARLADNNDIGLAEARKFLDADELEEFKWTVEEYIKRGKENGVSKDWTKELENASAKYHIRGLEAIQLQIRQECEMLYNELQTGLEEHLGNIYTEAYHRTVFEIQKGLGVVTTFATIDDRRIRTVLDTCWAADGKTFSNRIWQNKTSLMNELNTILTQSVIRGENPGNYISTLAKKMKTSRVNASRLIYTESAFVAAQADKDCYKDLGVKEFEFLATLDSHTSEICREMDGQHFPMSEYKIGVNAPPLHPHCRSTTCPYFNDEFTIGEERIARDENGNTYNVPADMTYKEWHEKYVEKSSKSDKVKSGANIKAEHNEHVLNDSTDKWAKEAKEELLSYESNIATRRKETAVVYDKNGKVLFRKYGNESEVSFTPLEFMKLRDKVITHNHPSGGSFSVADINLLRISGASELRVATEKCVYYLRQPDKWNKDINSKKKIVDERRKVESEVKHKYQRMYLEGKISKTERYQMCSEEVNRIFAERFGIVYGKEFY